MVGGEHGDHTLLSLTPVRVSVSICPDGRRSKIEHSFVLRVSATEPAPFKIFLLKYLFSPPWFEPKEHDPASFNTRANSWEAGLLEGLIKEDPRCS